MKNNKTEYMPLVSDCILTMLNGYNSGITQEQFYNQNIVDATEVTESDMQAVNDEVIQFCQENGCYAALPPFEEGSFIDHSERRYTHWKVLEVCEDYFRIEFDHYPIIFVDGDYDKKIAEGRSAELTHPCWYRSCKAIVKVKLLTAEEHMLALSRHPDFEYFKNHPNFNKPATLQRLTEYLRTDAHVGGVIEDYEYYMPHDLKKISKKGKYSTSDGSVVNGALVREVIDDTLAYALDTGLNSVLFCSTSPIVEMFTYINYMLSQKTTTGVSTLRHITSTYAPNLNAEDTRKERHFGKITLVSKKKPKAVTIQNVQRVYTTLSWQRRAHVRHLASGKVVPVKSATCKRHNAEDTSAPQVVYKV